MVKHIFSVDLEEWFHIIARDAPSLDEWSALESRVENSTLQLLELLDEHSTRATFFVLGWIAEKYPHLVREVAMRGHEIANHGYSHKPLTGLTPESFLQDLMRAESHIFTACAIKPIGYRAPTYSITPKTAWAWDLLLDEGYRYDASVFPYPRHDGGWPGAPSQPYIPIAGAKFWEMPVTIGQLGPLNFIFSAGGYLRITPLKVILACIRRLEMHRERVVFVIHPKDIDPNIPSPTKSRYGTLRLQLHIGSTVEKIRAALANFSFTTMIEVVEELERERKS